MPKVPQQSLIQFPSRPRQASPGGRRDPAAGAEGPPCLAGGNPGRERGGAPRAFHDPAPTFLDSRQLRLVDADFSHVGPGSWPPLSPASGLPPAPKATRAQQQQQQQQQLRPTRRKVRPTARAGREERAGRRAETGDKGDGRLARRTKLAAQLPHRSHLLPRPSIKKFIFFSDITFCTSERTIFP